MDSQFYHGEAINEKRDWGHSSNLVALQIAAQAKAKKLVLFHADPLRTDLELDEFLNNTYQHFETDIKKKYNADFPKEILLAYDSLQLKA